MSATDKDKEKKIVLFTYATRGTLGDASASAKLVRSMKEQYPDLDITVVLMTDTNTEAAEDLFDGLEITLHSQGPDPSFFNEHASELLHGADSLIFFPNSFLTKKSVCDAIFKNVKEQKIFIATEYDLPSRMPDALRSRAIQIPTGLDENSLGIFCTQEINASKNRDALSEIADVDAACRDLLLQGMEKKALFFGYYNQLNDVVNGSQVNPLVFINSCLESVSPDAEMIDFVLPIDPERSVTKSIDEIFSHFEATSTLRDYQLEFWAKDKEGNMTLLKKSGGGGKKIRFINGFPFAPDTMNKIMKASDDPVMVTGDQSLSEAIAHGKIFLYETMSWKYLLQENLIHLVKNLLGEDSKLYQFLHMQTSEFRPNSPEHSLGRFLRENRKILVEDMQTLQKHILENRNLYESLPSQLMSYFNDQEKYIADCLAKIHDIDSVDKIFPLLRIYPNSMDVISKVLKMQNKMSLLKAIEGFQKNMQDILNFGVKPDVYGQINYYDIDIGLLDDSSFTKFCDRLKACQGLGPKAILFNKFLYEIPAFNIFSLSDMRFAMLCETLIECGVRNLNGKNISEFRAEYSKIQKRLPEDFRLAMIQKKYATSQAEQLATDSSSRLILSASEIKTSGEQPLAQRLPAIDQILFLIGTTVHDRLHQGLVTKDSENLILEINKIFKEVQETLGTGIYFQKEEEEKLNLSYQKLKRGLEKHASEAVNKPILEHLAKGLENVMSLSKQNRMKSSRPET